MDKTVIAGLITSSVVFFILAVLFFIKWILLKKEMSKTNVEEEIIDLVEEGSKSGVLEDSEAEMIQNIFEFGDKMVRDIMTDRNQIAAIDAESTLAEAKEMMLKLPFSRFPVFLNDLDHIIGVIHLKDIVRYTNEDHDESEIIKNQKKLLRKAVFIPETRDVDDLFKEMQAGRIQMAIVVDEYGQTSGLIAMEDILEEIVGDITDEYDINDDSLKKTGRNRFEADGDALLEDLSNVFSVTFPNGEYKTLSGFIVDHLEHIPTKEDLGFSFSFENLRIEILSVENHVVEKALIENLTQSAPKEEKVPAGAHNS